MTLKEIRERFTKDSLVAMHKTVVKFGFVFKKTLIRFNNQHGQIVWPRI
jgi:hypothetical protein